MILAVTHEPIDPAAAYGRIAKNRAGSVVFHYAVVKSQSGAGGMTSCIEYDATAGTEVELTAIAAELQDKWQIEDLLLIRRVGCLGIGDIISLVAASSPNSEDAFAACRDGISRMKKMTTIVKQEIFAAA
ncbi:MAG TPA: molybdenum cofactor biosynthesis protein MoaE [Geobacteraceae bacterium]|nr:molybdenum cofactor biosynthesis protein MoaE [Geobacteraceae bacterium]